MEKGVRRGERSKGMARSFSFLLILPIIIYTYV